MSFLFSVSLSLSLSCLIRFTNSREEIATERVPAQSLHTELQYGDEYVSLCEEVAVLVDERADADERLAGDVVRLLAGHRRGESGLDPSRRATLPAEGVAGQHQGDRVLEIGARAARLRRRRVPALRLRHQEGRPRGGRRRQFQSQVARVQGGRHAREPGGDADVGLHRAMGGGRRRHGLLCKVQ